MVPVPDSAVNPTPFKYVFPDGLVVTESTVNHIWHTPIGPVQGPLAHVAGWARRMRIPLNRIEPVTPDRIHGTSVRYGNGADYRLVPSRSVTIDARRNGR